VSLSLTSFASLIEASLIIVTGTLPTMRLFLKHVAPTWIGDSEATQLSAASRELGWELQHRGTHDSYDIEDGSSERELFGKAI
jgi:hypothetical protein